MSVALFLVISWWLLLSVNLCLATVVFWESGMFKLFEIYYDPFDVFFFAFWIKSATDSLGSSSGMLLYFSGDASALASLSLVVGDFFRIELRTGSESS